MQVLAHNMFSQFTNRQLNITTTQKKKSSEKLSSGYRINRSSDDAAGLKISEKMRSMVRGLNRGGQNTQEGISFIQSADGAMEEISSIIQRIRELAVQASNDTNSIGEREAIELEITALKTEINRISCDAEFNDMEIFDNSYVSMEIFGAPRDLEVFDASYDAATGEVTWGGFIFHGERIPWDQVNPGMVTTDPLTNKQVFVGGDYSYTDPATGCQFNISCVDGDEVPKITRTLSIKADTDGIIVDGKRIGWENVHEDSGVYFFDYEGASIGFFLGNTGYNLIEAINSMNDGKVTYTWKSGFVGTAEETAVDASLVKNIHISNSVAQKLNSSDDFKFTLRADENGMWLEDGNNSQVTGSFKSWADLGINSWNTGSDISSDITYTYADTEGVEDTYISFDFHLSKVTSLDSVLDGLDGMEISGKNITTHYDTNLDVELDKNLVKVTIKSNNKIKFEEEKQLGRDFNQQVVDDVSDTNISYDKDTGDAHLDFKDAGGNSVLDFSGNAQHIENELRNDIRTYIEYVLRRKSSIALSGGDPQAEVLGSGSLTDLVGEDKITTSGYFDDVVTITDDMKLSDGEKNYKPGVSGKNYPAASIDFSGLGTDYQLSDLIGLGFNSTCKTCNKHYSIVFTSGGGSTPDGEYNYTYKQQGNNYVLQIDIDSLGDINNGADFTSALIDILSDCYDFHFTQYAADGSKLYIYDDRSQNTGTRAATFDTAPFNPIDTDEFQLSLKTDDGREIDLSYTYCYGDIAENITVEMTADEDGDYVLLDNGTYQLYDETKHEGMDRYKMDIVYKDSAGNPITGDVSDFINDYVDAAMDKMLGGSNVQLDATDYTYVDLEGDENDNVAIRAVFDSSLVMKKSYDNGLNIQHSSVVRDSTKIPRLTINTLVLNLHRAHVMSYEEAQDTLRYADYALSVLNDKRALYGAYQNRLEHTYANVKNMEENVQASESRLRDTDMADEMVNYSKHNILEQVGQSMLAQAKQNPQGILQLLQ